MKIERIKLKNFRNIRECIFNPKPHLNFLVGPNAQGKTSFLEAISYLSTLRSFKGAKPDEVIRWGAGKSEVICKLSTSDAELGDWSTELRVDFEANTKRAFIDQKPIGSSTRYLGARYGAGEKGFHAIIFNPSDHDLVRSGPRIRRSYLNQVLAGEDFEYLKSLKRYQRLLEQRNRLLKSNLGPPPPLLLQGFTEPLISEAAGLVDKRLNWLSRLGVKLQKKLDKIAPNQQSLSAIYLSPWYPECGKYINNISNLNAVYFTGQAQRPSLQEIQSAIATRFQALGRAEFQARTTLVGPHRDDWVLLLGKNSLKSHGSQGEVRSALLALKLSEIELFQESTGLRPLLLLDDFSSELDQHRREFLLRFLLDTDLQVFVTTTERPALSTEYFSVLEGQISFQSKMSGKFSGDTALIK